MKKFWKSQGILSVWKVEAMIGVNREVQWNQPGRVIVEGTNLAPFISIICSVYYWEKRLPT